MRKGLSWVVALSAVVGSCMWLANVGSTTGPAFDARWLDWLPTLRLLLIGVLSLASTSVALRHRNRLAFVFQAVVVLLGIWFAWLNFLSKPEQRLPYFSTEMHGGFVPAVCLLIVPGAFWYITGRCGWPAIVSKPISMLSKAAVLLCLLVLTVAGALAIDFRAIWSGECHHDVQPFAEQQSPQQAVFIARVIGSGLLWGRNQKMPGPRRYWALAAVQKRFWGLPWWDRRIVVLTMFTRGVGDPFPHDETDFVDGRRLPGSLTRFLPICETFCTRTNSVADAEVDLRVLHDGPHQKGVRILGRTVRLTADSHWETMPATKVEIQGPSGKLILTSDDQGIYDITGLPPGYYEVSRQPVEDVRTTWRDTACRWMHVESGDVHDCTVVNR